jgi:hypothetical protein
MSRHLEEFIFATLGPLVANKVHPVVVPQQATYPCIRYATISATPENSLCGSSGLVRSQVQVDIYAEEYATVRALREQVTAAMRADFPLENILLSEFEAFESEPKLFRRVLTYSTAEQEGP